MFSNSDATKLIQMCDDCRLMPSTIQTITRLPAVSAQVRTTEDYLSKRKDH